MGRNLGEVKRLGHGPEYAGEYQERERHESPPDAHTQSYIAGRASVTPATNRMRPRRPRSNEGANRDAVGAGRAPTRKYTHPASSLRRCSRPGHRSDSERPGRYG